VPSQTVLDAAPADPERVLYVLPDDAPVITTIGFVAPGIEMVMHAMTLLRSEHPDLQYVVAGPTHPELVRRDGERFRWCLAALAEDLRLSDRVHFVDRSLAAGERTWLLERSSAVAVPYRCADHAVPRTVLAAAVAGRPVIATRACAPAALCIGGRTIAIDADDDEACAAAIDRVVTLGGAFRAVGGDVMRHDTMSLS
jgi:glycosyltransferase involved in cell wall biosynthesis